MKRKKKPRKNIHRITSELLSRRKTGKHPEKTHGDLKGSSRLEEGLTYMRVKVCQRENVHFMPFLSNYNPLYSIVLFCFLDIIISNQFVQSLLA